MLLPSRISFVVDNVFTFITAAAVLFSHYSQASSNGSIDFKAQRESHKLKTLTKQKYSRLAGLSDMTKFKQILKPMLIERVADSDGNIYTQEHIKYWMSDRLGWEVSEDGFLDETPYGVKNFRNIVATQNPSAKRFLVLACHFDSKFFPGKDFIGATDSAVPCAMMIDLARALNYSLSNGSGTPAADISLQFIFFDGEEAFKEWTDTDSLYGSRHLANLWENTEHPHDSTSTVLDGMDVLILLDLIGVSGPKFQNFFDKTSHLHKRLASIESKLHTAGLLEEHHDKNDYFKTRLFHGRVEDDHIPFLKRDVPVLHLIAVPFPDEWHTPSDNESALHYPTIDNLNKIMRIFVSEYLHLNF